MTIKPPRTEFEKTEIKKIRFLKRKQWEEESDNILKEYFTRSQELMENVENAPPNKIL